MGPTTTVSPRTPSRWSSRDQRGSVLLLVLTVVLMLTVGVLALLSATLNTRNIADKLETDTRSLHRIDGALERAVNDVRDNDVTGSDPKCTEPDADQVTAINFEGYDVKCMWVGAPLDPLAPPPARTMDFEVFEAGESTLVGLARVRVRDEVNTERLVGHSIEICDWLLGRQSVGESFQGCS